MKKIIFFILPLVITACQNQDNTIQNKSSLELMVKKLTDSVYHAKDGMPLDIIMAELEQDSSGLELPALQSSAIAIYKGLWILIGGRKAGVHSMDNDPPSFNTLANNDTIWVINVAEKKKAGIKVPAQYWNLLSATNPMYTQDDQFLYMAGGYTVSDSTKKRNNWTSDRFIQISLPDLVNYVLSGGQNPSLEQVFTKVIQSPYVKLSGGEMAMADSNFYLIGGQTYDTTYEQGVNGKYSNAIRKFRLAYSANGWTLTDTASLIDSVNLHRRDFNMADIILDDGNLGEVIYGGVFTPDDMAYRNPVYITGLAEGKPAIRVDTIMKQVANLYTGAKINAFLGGSTIRFNHITLLGGISLLQYDTLNHKLTNPPVGQELPFSNLISSYITDGRTQSAEMVQLPPYPMMPGYLGTNAVFLPDPSLTIPGFPFNIDLNKVFSGSQRKKVLVGYLFGGIDSPVATLITPGHNYTSTANRKLYKVFMKLGVPVH
jgi:hypothetical protein